MVPVRHAIAFPSHYSNIAILRCHNADGIMMLTTKPVDGSMSGTNTNRRLHHNMFPLKIKSTRNGGYV
jgi:hypothetical protein